jgi:2-oxo-3-hexenedioate decarboxylase
MTLRSLDAVTDLQAVAAETLDLLDSGRQTAPFSSRLAHFDLDEAYRVTAAVRQMRETRGERVLGRKIGFTNRTIWDEYRVAAPMWGYVFDRTVHDLAGVGSTVSLAGLAEPRIEPEIIFGLATAPEPGMDERDLLACVDWVAHGFELVQSIFPRWDFMLPDTVAANGLHGRLMVGPRHSVPENIDDWARDLSTFRIDLKRDGKVVDEGRAASGGLTGSLASTATR